MELVRNQTVNLFIPSLRAKPLCMCKAVEMQGIFCKCVCICVDWKWVCREKLLPQGLNSDPKQERCGCAVFPSRKNLIPPKFSLYLYLLVSPSSNFTVILITLVEKSLI